MVYLLVVINFGKKKWFDFGKAGYYIVDWVSWLSQLFSIHWYSGSARLTLFCRIRLTEQLTVTQSVIIGNDSYRCIFRFEFRSFRNLILILNFEIEFRNWILKLNSGIEFWNSILKFNSEFQFWNSILKLNFEFK